MHSFDNGRRFFVMEYLPDSLEDLVMSRGADHREEMLAIVSVKMLDVVEKFHNLGFLHRDIKCSNFRVKNDEVFLVDFGTVTDLHDKNGNHIIDKS